MGQAGGADAARGAVWRSADTESSIAKRFGEVARVHGSRTAVAGSDSRPTFGELDGAASQFANAVVARSRPGSGRVALMMSPAAPLFAAALGALRAGKTVVALNVNDPVARLDGIRRDIDAEIVIVEPSAEPPALGAGFTAAQLLRAKDAEQHSSMAPKVEVSPADPAFLLYTSGSTGRPKGVIQTHRNVLDNVLRYTNGQGLDANDRIATLAPLSGGYGVALMCASLLNGATLCPFSVAELGFSGLAAWIEREQISFLPANSTVFRNFVATLGGRRIESVRLVQIAGEPAFGSDAIAFERHFDRDCQLVSALSASETGNFTQWWVPLGATAPADRLPVGLAMQGITVDLLDESGESVPAGKVGEIVVSGDHLSPGYWRDATLTTERFGVDSAGRRWFFTRDLGRRDADGLLTHVGRKDLMVKVRGNRVELTEVELAIAALPEVSSTAVCAAGGARGTELVAYLMSDQTLDASASVMHARLRSTLPDYAIPAAYVQLERFPLTSHGKVDRAALLSDHVPALRPGEQGFASEIEELLSGIWCLALGLPAVSRGDHFLDLGGDSLSAAVIAAAVDDLFGVASGLDAVLESPTIEQMATAIELRRDAGRSNRVSLRKISRAEPLPLSYTQERIWRLCGAPRPSTKYSTGMITRIAGPLDVDALRWSIEALITRHEALRTAFVERDGRPVQIGRQPARPTVEIEDISSRADPLAAVIERFNADNSRAIDLASGRLTRFTLLRTRADEHHLVRASHHIIADGQSWEMFLRELGDVYLSRTDGTRSAASEGPPFQYADYAVWEREQLSPGASRFESECDWWQHELTPPVPALALPFERDTPTDEVDPADGRIFWGIDAALSNKLRRVGREVGATFFMVRLAAFAAHLADAGAGGDFVLGTYATQRRGGELNRIFGDFSNLVALRLRYSSSLTFREWASAVRATVIGANAHGQVPYDELCDALRGRGVEVPAVEAIVNVDETERPIRFGELELTRVPQREPGFAWGCTLCLNRADETRCDLRFDPRRYDPAAARAFIVRFVELLRVVAEHPDEPLRRLATGRQRRPARARTIEV